MIKWEYLEITIGYRVIDELNALGQNGWELIERKECSFGDGRTLYTCLFKRVKHDDK